PSSPAPATPAPYTHAATLALPDALPISNTGGTAGNAGIGGDGGNAGVGGQGSAGHTCVRQSL
ncbi:hypothetical protein, partial [Mycobacterium tuberculosis]|uniref:hypothetical protein n=1 Tax=Mycobacterium tuberculosis TaxID=1773 RepID=UPI00135D9AC2|nr:hypothetical protein [Mycobacterium tuberculosis]